MPTASIIGCSGYTGQETLDRVLALPELYPPTGTLIANPGCYATAVLLALGPLADSLDPESVVVDAKSGVSGAGRAPKPSSHAGFVLENLSPYRAGSHQHAPELEQALGFPVCFVPHLLPLRRGLLATCYARAGNDRSEEHTSELQSRENLVCRLLLEKKKKKQMMLSYLEKKKKKLIKI